ncbi:hypothetical protein [uncultured Pantoea sp.]|uniref:hypothetical protein n=1 Tax=uncultured Pantoea sp. TaxID=218084 RepID=UPI0025897972|nr:hypothetical protein [uncultured Pantoea sp.]
MGSREDTEGNAPELAGRVISQLLSEKASVKKEDFIHALHRLGQETVDWWMGAACEKAVRMIKRRVH